MELDQISDSIKIASHTGHVISVEETIVLLNSLLILQNENHFRKVYFWGKIFGTDNDYYVAYGYKNDVLADRVFYYSTNYTHWGLLPKPKERAKKLSPLCSIKFQGDPALMLDILLEKDEIAFGDPLTQPQVHKLKEEDRLSATIHMINEEVTIVPRGGLFKRHDNIVVENKAFEGLPPLEAREIYSFLHLRKPYQKWNTNLLSRDDYNYALDFLDPLDVDKPDGCWILKLDEGEEVATIKSLYWPGMTFYHYLNTPRYGFIYFGNGIKCLDVPFFLYSLQPKPTTSSEYFH